MSQPTPTSASPWRDKLNGMLFVGLLAAAVRRALDGKKGLLRGVLGDEPASITKADIADAVKKHAVKSPIAARRALAYAHAFFNWCIHEDIIAANPAGTVKKPGKENQRDRYHTVDELAEIWEAAGTLGYRRRDRPAARLH